MEHVAIDDAATKLADLVLEIEKTGEDIVITGDDSAVAMIVPIFVASIDEIGGILPEYARPDTLGEDANATWRDAATREYLRGISEWYSKPIPARGSSRRTTTSNIRRLGTRRGPAAP